MRSLRVFIAAAVLGVVAIAGGGHAQAANAQAEPAAASMCNSTLPGSGYISHVCEYFITNIEYQDRVHYFVVGYYDSAVWHTWETAPDSNSYVPWASLGGVARSSVSLYKYDAGRALEVNVKGTDDGRWCRYYNDPSARGTWTGWYDCG